MLRRYACCRTVTRTGNLGKSASAPFVLHHSPADSLHLEAELFQFGLDLLSLIALNLDPSVLDGASGAAALLQRGSKLLQSIVVQRHIKHRSHAFAASSCC